jgi:hypothetical protein
MTASALPPERAGWFLLARRGLPLAVAGTSLVLALALPAARGWFLITAAACLAEVWPTFRTGEGFLRNRQASIRRDGLWARAFRPLARWLGREEAWILSFCAWNNRRVRLHFEHHRARNALVLLPHCIQLASCKAGILEDLGACVSCGRCTVGDILAHSLQGRWSCRITNRSHKAYREARTFQPDLIVAVSCADRLLKGLTRLPEVPCYVIPLQLPHGMCVDTTFRVEHLEAAMERLVEARPSGHIQPLRLEAGA